MSNYNKRTTIVPIDEKAKQPDLCMYDFPELNKAIAPLIKNPLKGYTNYIAWITKFKEVYLELDKSDYAKTIFEPLPTVELARVSTIEDKIYSFFMDNILSKIVTKPIRDKYIVPYNEEKEIVLYTPQSLLTILDRQFNYTSLECLIYKLRPLIKARKRSNDPKFLEKFTAAAKDFEIHLKAYLKFKKIDFPSLLLLGNAKSEIAHELFSKLDNLTYHNVIKHLREVEIELLDSPLTNTTLDLKLKNWGHIESTLRDKNGNTIHDPPFSYSDLKRMTDQKQHRSWSRCMNNQLKKYIEMGAIVPLKKNEKFPRASLRPATWLFWSEKDNASSSHKPTNFKRSCKLILSNDIRRFYNFYYHSSWTPHASFAMIRTFLKMFPHRKYIRLYDVSNALYETPLPYPEYIQYYSDYKNRKSQYAKLVNCINGSSSDFWSERIRNFFRRKGYIRSSAAIYYKRLNGSLSSVALILYDKFLIFDANPEDLKNRISTRSVLDSFPKSVYCGAPDYLLGARLDYHTDGRLLSINSYEFLSTLLHQIQYKDKNLYYCLGPPIIRYRFPIASTLQKQEFDYLMAQLKFIGEWARPDFYERVLHIRSQGEYNPSGLDSSIIIQLHYLLSYIKGSLDYSVKIYDDIPLDENRISHFINTPMNVYTDYVKYEDQELRIGELSTVNFRIDITNLQFGKSQTGLVYVWQGSMIHWKVSTDNVLELDPDFKAAFLRVHSPFEATRDRKMFGTNIKAQFFASPDRFFAFKSKVVKPFIFPVSYKFPPNIACYPVTASDEKGLTDDAHPGRILSSRYRGLVKPCFKNLMDEKATIYAQYLQHIDKPMFPKSYLS